MTGKLLQVVGVVAILGLVGASIAGFAVLKDRVRVVVQSDEADMGPDPTALLRDDVGVLSQNLTALQEAVASNFGQLATGLEQGATDRHADVLAMRKEVASLTGNLRTVTAELAAMQQKIAALQAVAVSAPAATAPHSDPKVVEPTAVTQPAAEPQSTPSELTAQAANGETAGPADAPADVPADIPAEKPKKAGGFLSFTLPKTQRAFDELQTYELLPKLCRVGFDAKSTLHDFTGVTSDVTGRFRADFDDPDGLCDGEVVANAKTLVTGIEGRDDNMYEHLDTAKHPDIRFAIERFAAADGGVDVKARTAKGEVVGKMIIRGVTRELRMPVEISVDAQQRLVVEGQAKLNLKDYEVPVPSQLGVINMEEVVNVWIALRARARGDAK